MIIGREKLFTILDSILAASKADDTEIFYYGQDFGLTRYANTFIHQNIERNDATISIRVAKGKKVGVSGCNSLEADVLKRCLADAIAIADKQKENPDYAGLPPAAKYAKIDTYVQSTADFGPIERAQALQGVFAMVKGAGQTMAGAFSNGESEVGIANSNGVKAHGTFTSATCNMVAMTDDSSGYAYATARDIGDIDLLTMADVAIRKAADSVNPISIEPGKYDVILEPPAISELVEWLSYIGLGCKEFHEGTSFMSGKLGQKVMGDNVTIYDDALDQTGMACPFDFEGIPKKRMDIIDKGVAKNVAYDYLWAKKEGKEPTGHGLPHGGGGEGGIPLNIIFKPGNARREDMIKAVDRGLLVTRFHYVNGLINPPEAVLTGMTRDGTFLIEKGEIKSGVKNLRFTESMLKAFSNIAMLGDDLTTVGAWWGDTTAMRVPSMLIRGFTFSGKTEF